MLADRVQIQQAIINLLLNAFDAVAEEDDNSRQVSDARWRKAPPVSGCVVRDSGRGIAPEALREFSILFSPPSLAVWGWVWLFGIDRRSASGRLSVSSNTGRGTTFEISLPIQLKYPSKSEPKSASVAQ